MARIIVVILVLFLVTGCASKEQKAQELFNQGHYQLLIKLYPETSAAKRAADKLHNQAIEDSLARARATEEEVARQRDAHRTKAKEAIEHTEVQRRLEQSFGNNLDAICKLSEEANLSQIAWRVNSAEWKYPGAPEINAVVDSCLERLNDHLLSLCALSYPMNQRREACRREAQESLKKYEEYARKAKRQIQMD
jgi:hypothetical protein